MIMYKKVQCTQFRQWVSACCSRINVMTMSSLCSLFMNEVSNVVTTIILQGLYSSSCVLSSLNGSTSKRLSGIWLSSLRVVLFVCVCLFRVCLFSWALYSLPLTIPFFPLSPIPNCLTFPYIYLSHSLSLCLWWWCPKWLSKIQANNVLFSALYLHHAK